MRQQLELVVDACVIVDSLIGNERSLSADARMSGAILHAPTLIDFEVVSAIARLERSGTIITAEAAAAIALWQNNSVQHWETEPLIRHAWKMRGSIRISDAFYLSLAAALDLPLVTSDARLTKAPHPGVAVMLVA